MDCITKEYFLGLFSTWGVSNVDHILSRVERCMIDDMNNVLADEYGKEELVTAMKVMGQTKALGANGFLVLFYQKSWYIISKDVGVFCLEIFNNGKSLVRLNNTYVALILNVVHHINITNFRPLSLCKVLYKIIAKTIANRLRNILDLCIDEAQCEFVLRSKGLSTKWRTLLESSGSRRAMINVASISVNNSVCAHLRRNGAWV
ncbi:hypothetical protein PVK06_040375 [Gossypium arboreum]|uniref:Reverse transcriptase n=1 Tax=Gossypium arboreum TaxID=29729 RepID=A0ABR0N620_GOSAR|nr:hypothetical protein PVK06_040375 [Gossypium arboreum]